jgi:hypothetical protein
MLTVTQDSTNKVVLNVTTTVLSPYFLIKFTNPFDCTTFTALFENKSTTSSYYLIWIEEVGGGGTESNVDGQIRLSPSGTYEIEIYAQTSSSNLDVSLADEFIVENLLIVINSEDCDDCTHIYVRAGYVECGYVE